MTTALYANAIVIASVILTWKLGKVQCTPNPIPVAGYPEKCYDFIVVGAGSAGCVVAGRLSEKYTVLLLEWGGEPDPGLDIPALIKNFYNNDFLHFYHTVPQKNAALKNNGVMAGKVLGGGSGVNAMFFNRGNPNDYDNWANITGDSSWRYMEMLKYFKKIEDYQGGWPLEKFHATRGPITVSRQKYAPGLDTWLEGGRSLGYPESDPNAFQTAGFIAVDFNKRHGKRISSYHGYVKPLLDRYNTNLKVLQHVKVNKILFEGTKAVGVQYVTKDGQKVVACVSKEVIISAGALSSPVVLIKSGIGPKKVLDDAGIAPVTYLPVGRNLHNHPMFQLDILMKTSEIQVFDPERDLNSMTFKEFHETGDGPYSCSDGMTAQAFTVSSVRVKEGPPSSLWPDLHLILMQTPSNIVADSNNNQAQSIDGDDTSISTLILLTRPKSLWGTITLNNTNIEEDPLVDFQYFSHPDDMEAIIDGIEQLLNLFENTAAYQQKGAHYFAEPLNACKNFIFRSRDYWECYVKYFTESSIHAAGTCRMGKGADDPDAVVDNQLRVIGIDNVRVADCSVMPVVTNANTNVPAMVIGEKVAADILEFWSEYGYTTGSNLIYK